MIIYTVNCVNMFAKKTTRYSFVTDVIILQDKILHT